MGPADVFDIEQPSNQDEDIVNENEPEDNEDQEASG